jgi:hypothetical protein
LKPTRERFFCIAWKLPDEFFPLIGHTRGRYFVDELYIFFLRFRILTLTFPRIRTGSSAPHRCRRTTPIRLVAPIKELGITPSRHFDHCRLTVTRSHHNPESQNAESRLLVADRGFLNTDSVGTGLALFNERTIGRYGGDRQSK